MASVSPGLGRQSTIGAGGAFGDDTLALLAIASTVVLAHLLTNGRYGFHRDELQVLSDARHLDWGFVPYPPFTPFLGTDLAIGGHRRTAASRVTAAIPGPIPLLRRRRDSGYVPLAVACPRVP